MSVPPAGPSPAQSFPIEPDPTQKAQELKGAIGNFVEGLENARKQPHLVDSPEALNLLAQNTRHLHQIAIQAGG